MSANIRAGDAVSLSRIVLAAAFLVTFRAQYGAAFLSSVAIAAIAQLSDHIDGYLIRKLAKPTLLGWVLDSFADRAFYFAAILAFRREFNFNEVLIWAFVLRELALYGMRVVSDDFQAVLPSFRTLALIHAGIIRLGIVLGCLFPFALLPVSGNVYLIYFAQALFLLATAMGYANLYVFIRAQKRRR